MEMCGPLNNLLVDSWLVQASQGAYGVDYVTQGSGGSYSGDFITQNSQSGYSHSAVGSDFIAQVQTRQMIYVHHVIEDKALKVPFRFCSLLENVTCAGD